MSERTAQHPILVPFLAGIAGATLALLFAPRSGKETRYRMKHKADKMKHMAEDKAKDAMDAGKEKAKEVKERLASAAYSSGDKLKSKADEHSDDMRSRRMQSPSLSNWEEEA